MGKFLTILETPMEGIRKVAHDQYLRPPQLFTVNKHLSLTCNTADANLTYLLTAACCFLLPDEMKQLF